MRARVYVTLKPSVFDPQGRVVADALLSLGYEDVSDVRQGKFFDLERTLDALAPGGLYVVDDMFPEAHDTARRELLEQHVAALAARKDLVLTGLPWGTGLVVATRRS